MNYPPSFDLVGRLRQLFPAAVIGDDIEVSADLAGQHSITAWHRAEPQPTEEDLRAVVLPEPDLVITDLQARRWLNRAGLFEEAVQKQIEAIPDRLTREDARADWDRALVVRLSSPLVQSIGAALGLDADKLRVAFTAAAAL